MPEHPESFEELFRFYHDYVKLLYSSVQVENHLPVELLFELNAALDHVSRHWIYKESENETVRLAYSHLKRCCLDVFKLRVKTAIDQYNELRRIDLSIVDNGTFENRLRALIQKIKQGASEARRMEGRTKEEKDGSIQAFAAWEPVFADCVRLEKEFYYHSSIDWAKRRGFWRSTKALVYYVLTTAIVMVFLKDPLVALLRWGAIKVGLMSP
jgi:hypothetical protein